MKQGMFCFPKIFGISSDFKDLYENFSVKNMFFLYFLYVIEMIKKQLTF